MLCDVMCCKVKQCAAKVDVIWVWWSDYKLYNNIDAVKCEEENFEIVH